ncbi:hypothetical protein ACQ4LE_008875 [Meloidogyne hapla]|uniref:diphosphoinositol-polyphosphate diphosphatase n=1 Tax=Meloidogyne hapla TaxID=6305 RepID=A0A1I8B935_MELHA
MCTKDNTNSKQNGSSTSKVQTEIQEYPKASSSKDYNKEAGKAANGDRIRDKDGYRQRAAAFCLRLTNDDNQNIIDEFGNIQNIKAPLEVLLVSGRRDGSAENYWVLPGGGVELKESTEEAVVRELREEAGIQGQVLFPIGKFIDDQRFHHTTLYCLSVLKTFDEWENCENGRERRWMNLEEARRCVKPNQFAMLEQSITAVEEKWLSCILTLHRKKCFNISPNLILTILGEENISTTKNNLNENSLINSETAQNNNTKF